MKKCPICEKTFEDSMRFCQTDGTPLLNFIEAAPDDPLKTTLVRQDEIASMIPPEDPFKTGVADSKSKDDSGDLLQLPEEFDAMKTVVSPSAANFDLNLSEPQDAPILPSSSPFDTPFEPKIEAPLSDFTVPEPPKFSEPSLSPPNFGNMSAPQSFDEQKYSDDEPPPTAIYMPDSNPFSSEPLTPQSPFGSSPFDKPMNNPMDAPIPSPFDAPKPVIPAYKEPEPIISTPQSNPFDTPSPFGGGQMEQQNQGFNQPVQQNDWTPPPAPGSNWQDQGLGANTPFQPPMSGGGQDQTMAVVSLICGIAGFVICQLVAPVALVTGFMARKKAQENPQQFGGEGLALAGMILGGIGTLLLLLILVWVVLAFGSVAIGNM